MSPVAGAQIHFEMWGGGHYMIYLLLYWAILEAEKNGGLSCHPPTNPSDRGHWLRVGQIGMNRNHDAI